MFRAAMGPSSGDKLCLCDTWYLFFCMDGLTGIQGYQSSILLVDYMEMRCQQNKKSSRVFLFAVFR